VRIAELFIPTLWLLRNTVEKRSQSSSRLDLDDPDAPQHCQDS